MYVFLILSLLKGNGHLYKLWQIWYRWIALNIKNNSWKFQVSMIPLRPPTPTFLLYMFYHVYSCFLCDWWRHDAGNQSAAWEGLPLWSACILPPKQQDSCAPHKRRGFPSQQIGRWQGLLLFTGEEQRLQTFRSCSLPMELSCDEDSSYSKLRCHLPFKIATCHVFSKDLIWIEKPNV